MPNYSFGSRQQQELNVFTLMSQRRLCWCKDSTHFWFHVHEESEIWIPESSEVCTVCDKDQEMFYNSIILKVSLETRLKLQVKNIDLGQRTTVFSVCHLSWGTIVSTRYVHQQMETGLSQGEELKKKGLHCATKKQTTTTTTTETTLTSSSWGRTLTSAFGSALCWILVFSNFASTSKREREQERLFLFWHLR